ncbi:peptidase M14 [Salinibacter sp. 10B]|uniref:M14 family zinc carboxypeptidase n=1 Tax=Salinibacter sp. 10B TaxID=1923971 RepID=UPI000CF3E702|nr:M14 family zinc carboxypeptidase [Salinibacter sp. 10B]PQJ33293.1 peptidase M14 [Salinibacter sp. 10B]
MPFSLTSLVDDHPRFRTHGGVRRDLETACLHHPDIASFEEIGPSEEGAMLYGVRLGTGDRTVSLIAGNHADEPVGPETLRTLVINALSHRNKMEPWLRRYTFVIVPHTNPDGEARNRRWIEAWPDMEAYLRHAVREKPGRDLEYGYPAMRPENEHVSGFLQDHGPFAMHMSLHGMSASEGAMLLINRPWTFRTQELRDAFTEAAAAEGLRMHDHNRKGEKGFFWIEPGFQTTPRGDAMRTYFQAQDDPATARQFHDSSMEFVMSLGGDPLAMVTELPLFLVENEDPTPGRPDQYLALRERLPEVKARLEQGKEVDDLLAPFKLRPVPLDVAMRLQLQALELGLEAVAPIE